MLSGRCGDRALRMVWRVQETDAASCFAPPRNSFVADVPVCSWITMSSRWLAASAAHTRLSDDAEFWNETIASSSMAI